ncbi:MAG: hypothetical protein QOD99_3060 [Chthoniobacter sp.]|nr:hypothetical protein [Chthoniobacter sp.]
MAGVIDPVQIRGPDISRCVQPLNRVAGSFSAKLRPRGRESRKYTTLAGSGVWVKKGQKDGNGAPKREFSL